MAVTVAGATDVVGQSTMKSWPTRWAGVIAASARSAASGGGAGGDELGGGLALLDEAEVDEAAALEDAAALLAGADVAGVPLPECEVVQAQRVASTDRPIVRLATIGRR
jgi:hypothetical protein